MTDWEIQPLSDGPFWLDGGTIFGTVPKALWQKLEQPDEKNRIPVALTSYLLRNGSHTVLLEAGMGEGYTPKQMEIYGLSDEAPRLPDQLRDLGVAPEDVDMVILSHLHLDHAGWCTRKDGDEFVPTFPNAEYIVQRGEFESASAPNPYTRGSYLPRHIEPIERAGLWGLVDGDAELLPGLSVAVTGGHTVHHQIAVIENSDGRKSCFLGDFVPTRHHLRVHYASAYDQYPLELVNKKIEMLATAAAEEWQLLFNHDSELTIEKIRAGDDGHYHIVP